MKIKHFSGYGSVNAKYVKKTTWTGLYGEMFERRYVVVTGNHERGLYSDYMDNNDIYNWLVKRLFKDIKRADQVKQFTAETEYVVIDGLYVEQCTYGIAVRVIPN